LLHQFYFFSLSWFCCCLFCFVLFLLFFCWFFFLRSVIGPLLLRVTYNASLIFSCSLRGSHDHSGQDSLAYGAVRRHAANPAFTSSPIDLLSRAQESKGSAGLAEYSSHHGKKAEKVGGHPGKEGRDETGSTLQK
jgi:hypothetical protein